MTRRSPRAPDPGPSVDVDFDSPPLKEGPRYDWSAIADRLRAEARTRPGEWGKIFTQDRATYYSALMQGSMSAIGRATTERSPVKDGSLGFEVRAENTLRGGPGEPRLCDLWMRYNPAKDTTT